VPKKSWNIFVCDHPSRFTFFAAIPASLPAGTKFDRTGAELPSPFGLFNEWASGRLTGEWASSKVRGGFVLAVSERSDFNTIKRMFGFVGPLQETPASPETQQIGYTIEVCPRLASHLGYNI